MKTLLKNSMKPELITLQKIMMPGIIIGLGIFLLFSSCVVNQGFRNVYSDYHTFKSVLDTLPDQPFLKAHLKNGDLALFFGQWNIDSTNGEITGRGSHFNYSREPLDSGQIKVNISDVILFETNAQITSNEDARFFAVAILTAANLGLTIYCISNPKACFGSCPTFYLDESTNVHHSDAEGFSSSILPSLKASDIDALNNPEVTSRELDIVLKNEALETHVIDKIKLLAVPRELNSHAYHGIFDDFYTAKTAIEPIMAVINSDCILDKLKIEDKNEWFSLADSKDLGTKEEIILIYKNPVLATEDSIGFCLSFRQSLMTTYLFYNMMDYMGGMATSFSANIEKGNLSSDAIIKMYEALGGIEVCIWKENLDDWLPIGTYNEAGPIAINKQIIPFNHKYDSEEVKIKLRMTQGLWRLDCAQLIPGIVPVSPVCLDPVWIKKEGQIDLIALEALQRDDQNLITLPGDKYKIGFELPEQIDYELFLWSKGYYLEWLRPEWLETKNLRKLNLFINNPRKFLKKEARAFKLYEDKMEEFFWNSRIN